MIFRLKVLGIGWVLTTIAHDSPGKRIENMPLHPEISLIIKLEKITGNHEKDRNALRTLLLDKLVKEKAGAGNKEKTSKYHYNVETLASGKKVYLTRPVPLNKGFDFIIHVQDYTFINGKDNPRHDDILNDLKIKKQEALLERFFYPVVRQTMLF